MPILTVNPSQHKQRLDQVLVSVLPSLSRATIQKAIKAGDVTINDLPAKPHTPVQTGEVIFYHPFEKAAPAKKQRVDVPILYEDKNLIVIDKPAGLLVHRTNDIDDRPSVVDFLLKHVRGIKNVGDNPLRPGIVHRLDRDVSGVMVIAKTPKAFTELKTQFQKREVEKIYTALVYGKLPKDHGEISFAIARSKSQGRMVARTGEQEGKEAMTTWDLIQKYKNTSLVRVRIHTGRTHQIRVHFLAIDHPVVGDKLYRKKSMRHTKEKNLGRLFLHAASLTFTDLSGDRVTYTSPLPETLQTILDTLPKT